MSMDLSFLDDISMTSPNKSLVFGDIIVNVLAVPKSGTRTPYLRMQCDVEADVVMLKPQTKYKVENLC